MRNIFITAIIVLLITSCNDHKKDSKLTKDITVDVANKIESEGLILLQQKCYACHSVTTKSHDEIIAPPMVAVKRRYKNEFLSKDEFVEGFTNWVLDPKEEHALMRGAVDTFNVMPKQPFEKEDIVKIAVYIYENELERPEWFDAHFNEEHPNGMQMGRGKRRKNR